MQYSNPWSCSMGGWLISSGFASAISPDELRLFDPKKPTGRALSLGPPTGRALSLGPPSTRSPRLKSPLRRTPIRLVIPARWLSSAGRLSRESEKKQPSREIEMKRLHGEPPPVAGEHQDEIC